MEQPAPKYRPRPRFQRIISVDLERTELFGEIIAIGASIQEVMDLGEGFWTGGEQGYWFSRVDHRSASNQYVKDNIIPVLERPYDGIEPGDLVSFDEAAQRWWGMATTLTSIGFKVITHVPMPVETEFFGTVHRPRADHPFPLLDICSMIVQSGYQGDPTELDTWWRETIGTLPSWYVPHHPLADARLAGAAYWALLGGKVRG